MNDAPFAQMKKGEKYVEMRLYDEKRQLLRVGDCIQFTNAKTGEVLNVNIVDLQRFSDFFELYRVFDKIAVGYTAEETAKAEDMYVYYPKEEIEKCGVLAIVVQVVK